MKILMILSKPFKPEPWIYKEARTLFKNGHDVTIIGWDRKGKYKKEEEIDGIKIERVELKASYGSFIRLLPLFPFFYLILLIKSIAIDFDVVECHNFDTLPVAIFVGKIKRKKVIYHSLDLYFTWFDRETESKFKKVLSKLFKKLEILFLSNIDHLIVTTPAFLEYYKGYCNRCGITVLLNVPNKNFCASFNDENGKNESDEFVISYIGEIRYEKPIVNLIIASQELKNVKVLIVGGGVKAESIKQKSKGYKNVSILGEVTYSEVVKYYHQSNCIYAVYDSKVENIKYAMPVKVFEGMACSKPVIVNKNIWVSEFVSKNEIGLCVDENDREEIKNAIIKIKNNRNLRNEFGNKGMKLIEEKYNWEKQEGKLLEIYGRLRDAKK